MSVQDAADGRGGALFIVVEGVDGAGTTTLMNKLVAHFRQQRRPVHGTCEPTGGPIGAIVRQVLSRRLVVQSMFGVRAPGWTTMALLFAADRQDHLEAEILPLLHDGVSVISDRYDLSSLAYQSATATPESASADSDAGPSGAGLAVDHDCSVDLGMASPSRGVVDWIRALNRYARRPDLTLVVDVSPEVAAQRRRNRGGRVELYEDGELQRRLCEAYRHAEALAPGDRIVHLDGNRSEQEVLAAAIAAIDELRRI